MSPFIVGIRFHAVGKVYHFDASAFSDTKIGDFVIVDTIRGLQLGEVIQLVEKPTPPPEGTWKPIRRPATPRDLVMRQLWQKKELEATINCRAKLAEFRFPGVKIVASEFAFDGSRLAFLYSTENEAKVELKSVRNAMQRIYPQSKVEMRQIGPRDVAKLLGGMGACGMEKRCCSMFLTDFSPISIKMAKEQGISLTPSEITGMCGRLRCCLVYEYEQYVEARKILPKRNKRVITPQGEGKVVDTFPLKEAVLVELDTGTLVECFSSELQPWDELEALRRKSQEPCDHHENGECDCGKVAPNYEIAEDEGSLDSFSSEKEDSLTDLRTNPPPPQNRNNYSQRPSRPSQGKSDRNEQASKRQPQPDRNNPPKSNKPESSRPK